MPPSRSSAKTRAAAFNAGRQRAYESACADSLRSSRANLDAPLSAASRRAVEAALNAALDDPYGDGDQSPIPPLSVTNKNAIVSQQEALRSAWSSGLDLHLCLLGDVETWFHRDCFEGEVEDVREAIEEAKEKEEEGEEGALMRLLEGRLSMLRLTPLHVCCHGARMHGGQGGGDSKYGRIARILLENGARVDARDICGYTALSTAAGFQTTGESLELVDVLMEFGADVNVVTRFGEGLLVPAIMSANVAAFRRLIRAGADVNLGDRTGLTPREMALSSQGLMREIVDGQRQRVLGKMECEGCGKVGARKHCSRCKKAFYCDKECQRGDWKRHKGVCGRGEFVDVVVGVGTSVKMGGSKYPTFMNNITGISSNRVMRKKEGVLVVKVTKPLEPGECVKINQKNSDWLLVKRGDVYDRLLRVIMEEGIEQAKVYLSAKWVEDVEVQGKFREVLRVDVSKALPPPKPLW